MKKILALVMMLCLLCGAAMAEEVTWADIEPQLAENGLSGDFVVLDQLGLKVWLPTGMNAAAVSEEDAASGRVAAFAPDDGSAYFVVDAVNMGEMTIDQLLANVSNNETVTDAEIVVNNGLSVVSYKNTASDCLTAALVDTNSNVIMFTMGPASAEGAAMVFYFIMSSLQPAE